MQIGILMLLGGIGMIAVMLFKLLQHLPENWKELSETDVVVEVFQHLSTQDQLNLQMSLYGGIFLIVGSLILYIIPAWLL